jgi:hypothetical protein
VWCGVDAYLRDLVGDMTKAVLAVVNVNSEQEFMRAGKRLSFKGKGAVRNFFADAYGLSGSERGKGRCEINCFVLSYRFVRLRTKVRIMLENRER